MSNKILGFVFANICLLGVAHADDHGSMKGTWFGAVDYSVNLDTQTSPTDASGEGEPYAGGLVDELDTSWGVGIGYRYPNNMVAMIRYEEADIEPNSVAVVTNDPSSPFDVTSGGGDITNVMLEGAYFMPISPKFQLFALAGIGYADIESNPTYFGFEDGPEQVTCSESKDSVSYRLGLGGAYYLTEKNGFYAGLTHTNYGDMKLKDIDEDTGLCATTESTAYDKDVQSQDLRLGFFFRF